MCVCKGRKKGGREGERERGKEGEREGERERGERGGGGEEGRI